MASESRPSGLVANKGIELLTWGTPNGWKASIMLEELKEAYGKDYTFQGINIGQNIQKEPWFTKLGPNGRIPVIVDHDQGGFAVQEGLSTLPSLARHYDPEHKFHFSDPLDTSRTEQWMAWQHGGLGPMQGQANHFGRYAPEKIPYGVKRYIGESERLYGILDNQLKDRDYLVGPGRGKYSIADIASFGWVNIAYYTGLDLKQFPNVERWYHLLLERPAVKKGLDIPTPSKLSNVAYLQRLKDDPEFKKQEDEYRELIKTSKEKYDYKYESP